LEEEENIFGKISHKRHNSGDDSSQIPLFWKYYIILNSLIYISLSCKVTFPKMFSCFILKAIKLLIQNWIGAS
jgi:hypothetical protein